jgi:hypothetical protein
VQFVNRFVELVVQHVKDAKKAAKVFVISFVLAANATVRRQTAKTIAHTDEERLLKKTFKPPTDKGHIRCVRCLSW